MTITIGNTYEINHIDYIFRAKLISIPNRNNTHYRWVEPNGNEFMNRQQDIDRWIFYKCIKDVTQTIDKLF
jgi:hypothetical protein